MALPVEDRVHGFWQQIPMPQTNSPYSHIYRMKVQRQEVLDGFVWAVAAETQ
jgi:hypothetical protein